MLIMNLDLLNGKKWSKIKLEAMNIKEILFHNISKINPLAFGLDLSDLSLKIALLKKKKRGIGLEAFGRKEIPQGIIQQGKIKKESKLVEIIKQAIDNVQGKKLNTKYVSCSLPEKSAFVQVIKLPKMKLAEARKAVKWEAEANIPVSINKVYLDWQLIKPLASHLDHLDILINAVPKKIVDSYAKALNKAGLIPVAMEVESMATARSLISNQASDDPVLIIDLGATRTSFIIFWGYAVRFTASISISNRKMIDTIAKHLNISSQKAKQLKFKIGLNKDKDSRVLKALLPTLNDLVEQIKKYFAFYREHSAPHEQGASKNIAKIILCGGGANLSQLPQFLSARLDIPVERGNPWINIFSGENKSVDLENISGLSYQQSLAYTTALGLALRSLEDK